MAIFVSYSSRDGEAVRRLKSDIESFGLVVWSDQDLRGGDVWWRAILEQIRTCTVFVLALSENAARSEPCQAEVEYARKLGRPVLPVRIGPVKSMRLLEVADLQMIDYERRDAAEGIALVAAVNRCAGEYRELPDPMPEPPPIPYEYLLRVRELLRSPDIGAADQASAIAELREAHERVDDDGVRGDIVDLLRELRAHPDLTARNASVIDAMAIGVERVGPPRDDPAPPAPPRRGVALLGLPTATAHALSVTAAVLGLLSLVLFPVLLGSAAVVAAVVAVARRERYAVLAASVATGGVLLGSTLGLLLGGA